MLNDYESDYKTLLDKADKPTMETKRLRILALEIFKTLNDLNPSFMKEIWHFSVDKTHRKNNLFVHTRNTSNHGDKSLKILGPHMWNSLPESIKSEKSLQIFKSYIKNWYGPNCKCKMCSFKTYCIRL